MIPTGIVASAHKTGTAPVLLLDSFNRADGTVGNLDTGQTWVAEAGGSWVVSSNALAMTGGTNKSLTVNVGSTSMRVAATRLARASAFTDIVASVVGASDYYRFQIDPTNGALYVGRLIGGVNTWLWNGAPPGGSYTGRFEFTIKHEAGGTLITASANGTVVYSTTDTTSGRPTGTYAGFRTANPFPDRVWDDFEAEAL